MKLEFLKSKYKNYGLRVFCEEWGEVKLNLI